MYHRHASEKKSAGWALHAGTDDPCAAGSSTASHGPSRQRGAAATPTLSHKMKAQRTVGEAADNAARNAHGADEELLLERRRWTFVVMSPALHWRREILHILRPNGQERVCKLARHGPSTEERANQKSSPKRIKKTMKRSNSPG